jgi:adenosylcobinamide-GDP ribazoletransferase
MNWMLTELRALGVAIAFLTRLPVPNSIHQLAPGDLQRATSWFPLVGALVGLITAALAVFLDTHLPFGVALLIALLVEARLTGAFHEDAVADAFDAFGGGFSRERVLEILKDSRIGSYGALALFGAFLLRYEATKELPSGVFYAAVVAAASMGRLSGMLLLAALPTIPERASLGRDLESLPASRVAGALVTTLPAFLWLAWLDRGAALLALLLCAVAVLVGARYVGRRIGGSTGDALGTLTYAVQLTTLIAVLWR